MLQKNWGEVQYTVNLAKIDTLLNLEKELKIAAKEAEIHSLNYNEDKKSRKLWALANTSRYDYLNALDRFCYFLLISKGQFLRDMQTDYTEWIIVDTGVYKNQIIAQPKNFTNLQKICNLWGIKYPI